MKRIILFVLIAIISAWKQDLFAQELKIIPAYWVVETNLNRKNYSIVRLYDVNNELIQEVRLDKIYLNPKKTKHKKMLNEFLKGSYPKVNLGNRKDPGSKKRSDS